MKMRIAVLSLLTMFCVALAAIPAMAAPISVIYSNGGPVGNVGDYLISNGNTTSDSFTCSSSTCTPTNLRFYEWNLQPGAQLTNFFWSISTAENGGILIADGRAGVPSALPCITNVFGISVCQVTSKLVPLAGFLPLSHGTYWLNLSSARDASGPVVTGWDDNGGPSQASTQFGNAVLNNIGSEAFTIYGTTTPEPGSILLLGSGILGVAGVLRRKLIR